jgi:hypothetical protein
MSISQISHISNIAITMLWWTPVARPRGTTWRQSAWKPHAPCVRLWRRRSGLKFVIYMVGFFFLSLMMLLPVYIYEHYIYMCVYTYNQPELWKWTNEEFCSYLKMNNSRKKTKITRRIGSYFHIFFFGRCLETPNLVWQGFVEKRIANRKVRNTYDNDRVMIWCLFRGGTSISYP